MTHRVRLDYICPADALDGEGDQFPPLIKEALERLTKLGWESARGSQAEDVFNRMAAELPDSDLPSFVRNTRYQMFRSAPMAELTLGYFSDQGTGHIRIRVRASNNAKIVDLGRKIATALLRLSAVELANMDLLESRHGESLLQGREARSEPYRFLSRANLAISLPLLFSTAVLLLSTAVAFWSYADNWSATVMGDELPVWYGRLFAPLIMAIVTTVAVVIRDYQRAEDRFAEWILD